MPRKTKKDKVIARLRRELASQRVSTVLRVLKVPREKELSSLPTPITKPTPKNAYLTPSGQATHNPPPLLTYPVSYIKKDLTKTLSLAILAISLEVGIYYLLKLEFLPF